MNERPAQAAAGTMDRTDQIRVLLVDDHAIVRAGLKAVLALTRDISVVGEASDGREALVLVDRYRPDVVVMDLGMGGMDGIEATKALAARDPAPRILILTMHAEEEYLVPLLEAGAAGYLVKSSADRELVDAIRIVAHGDMFVRSTAASVLARKLARRDLHTKERAKFEKLSARERDVLRLIAEGYTAPEIGDQLHISAKTVDTYKQRIAEKLDLSHRTDYVKFALRLGLLVPDIRLHAPPSPGADS